MAALEAPAFNPQAFDASFFAAYEQELADVSLEDQASAALADILTIQKADGTEKTYEEIRSASIQFFASEVVQRDEALMNRMTVEFALGCMAHAHGSELAQDGALGSVFETGMAAIFPGRPDDHPGHDSHGHDSHESAKHDEKDTKANKNKKKETKKSWWEAMKESIKQRRAALAKSAKKT